MAAKKQTYEQAMKRLEEIVSRIDSNELDTDRKKYGCRWCYRLHRMWTGCRIAGIDQEDRLYSFGSRNSISLLIDHS